MLPACCWMSTRLKLLPTLLRYNRFGLFSIDDRDHGHVEASPIDQGFCLELKCASMLPRCATHSHALLPPHAGL